MKSEASAKNRPHSILSSVVPGKGRHDLILHSFILSSITRGEVERLNPTHSRLSGDLPGRLSGQVGALGR